MIHVSRHACERWVQRVDPSMTLEQAKAEIETHREAILAAAAFGARCVVVSRRIRLMLAGTVVTTIKDNHPAEVKLAFKTVRRGMRKAGRRAAA